MRMAWNAFAFAGGVLTSVPYTSNDSSLYISRLILGTAATLDSKGQRPRFPSSPWTCTTAPGRSPGAPDPVCGKRPQRLATRAQKRQPFPIGDENLGDRCRSTPAGAT